MKRALLLAYFFPPRMAAGTARAHYLAKYLPRFDWDVTVVTAKFLAGVPPPWATIIETNYTDVIERAKHFVGVSRKTTPRKSQDTDTQKAGSRLTLKQRLVEAAY